MTAPLSEAEIREALARAERATPDGPLALDEQWLPVVGYEGLYEVSDHGAVRSFHKPGRHREKFLRTPRRMSGSHSRGYRTVGLARDGDYRTKLVHLLVLQAFVGPRPSGMEGAHLNGDPSDNRLVNLRWCSHRENESHKVAHGTAPIGERNGASVLVAWQVETIRYLASKSMTLGKIADLFDISRSTVQEIVSGERWRVA